MISTLAGQSYAELLHVSEALWSVKCLSSRHADGHLLLAARIKGFWILAVVQNITFTVLFCSSVGVSGRREPKHMCVAFFVKLFVFVFLN